MFYPILMAVALINDNASCLPVASFRNVTEMSALWVASNQANSAFLTIVYQVPDDLIFENDHN